MWGKEEEEDGLPLGLGPFGCEGGERGGGVGRLGEKGKFGPGGGREKEKAFGIDLKPNFKPNSKATPH